MAEPPAHGTPEPSAAAIDIAARARALIERGAADEAAALIAATLPKADGAARGALLMAQAGLHGNHGRHREALAAAIEAGEACQRAGDVAGGCDALVTTAGILRAAGDHATALSLLERAEPLARKVGDALRLGRVMRQIGVVSSILGQHQHAQACLEQALELLADTAAPDEYRQTRQSALNAISRRLEAPATGLPPSDALETHLAAWLALASDAETAGQTRLALMALGNHAIMLQAAARPQAAADALRALVPRYRALGMRPNEALAHAEAGRALESLGDVAAARQHYLLARTLLADAQTSDDLLQTLEGLARCEESLGDLAAALATLKALRDLEARRRDAAARQALLQRELRIELARLTSQWARQATLDPLTGLANRRALEQWLARQWPRAEQGQSLALLLLDLDHFKGVNDRLGHATGDAVLQAVAAVLGQHTRGTDLAVRYGGEEFLLALADATPAQAAGLAERLRAAIAAEPWERLAPGLRVSASIGVAGAGEALSSDALLALADQRLYAAKLGGRDRIVAAS